MKVWRLIRELCLIYVHICFIQEIIRCEAMEINELKYEDRIKEFENEQGI